MLETLTCGGVACALALACYLSDRAHWRRGR